MRTYPPLQKELMAQLQEDSRRYVLGIVNIINYTIHAYFPVI